MTESVNLYLASGVRDGIGFWVINFTGEDDIFNSHGDKLLECYRKELFGIKGAIEVKEAINTTLDILALDSKFESYKLDNYNTGYSYEIPIHIIENIFDLWVDNYNNETRWKKYIGLLNFRKTRKGNNNFINMGLKGETYEFAMKLDELLSIKPIYFSFNLNKLNDSMW